MNGDFFKIDVTAEIDKLVGKRFKSAGDYAVELIRYAASCNASTIDISVNARSFTLTHDGDGMKEAHMERLVTIFDGHRPDNQRHLTIVEMEEKNGLELIAAFSVRKPKIIIGDVVGKKKYLLEFSRAWVMQLNAHHVKGFSITVKGSGRKPSIEKRMIKEACRYSLVTILLNGERINHGLKLSDTLIRVDIKNSRLLGVVGLPNRKSNLTRIVRLQHGIRVEEIVRPSANGILFHAVINELDKDFDASFSTLRRAANRLYSRISQRFDDFGDIAQQRILELLCDRFSQTQDHKLMKGVNAFPIVGSPPVDMNEVTRLASTLKVYAINTEESPKQYDVEDRVVFRLSPGMRHFFEKELTIKFVAPPLFSERLSVMDRYRNIKHRIVLVLKNTLGGKAGDILSRDDLTRNEVHFLEAVNAEVRSGGFMLQGENKPFGIRVFMADGQRRPWIKVKHNDGRSEYRISRNHLIVNAMITAHTSDPSYIYPALSALTNGWDGYSDTRISIQNQILEKHGA